MVSKNTLPQLYYKINIISFLVFGGSLQKNKGVYLSVQQFYGMFVKRVIHSKRNWLLTLSQLLVPMFFTLMACLIDKTIPEAKDSPSLKLAMNEFSTGQIAVFSENTDNYNGQTSNLATGTHFDFSF